jgi:hypothetical protein
MIKLENALATLFCDESGKELAILDKVRRTKWLLDEKTLVYGTKLYNDMYEGRADFLELIPESAELLGEDGIGVIYLAGNARVKMVYTLEDRYVEVRVPVPENGHFIGYVSMPGSFSPAGEKQQLLLPIMQGMQWDGRGEPFSSIRSESGHMGFSMPWIGHIGESGGLLFTAETRDDLWWWFGKDETGRFWASNVQISSLGTMRYERVGRIYFTDAGIVSIAKTYRKKVIDEGRFKNWDAKIAERPGLERIFGSLMCYIGYCRDDVDYVESCKKLKAYGFDRAFVYPGRFNMYYKDIHMGGEPAIDLSREAIEQIKALGYDMAPWSWLNEALDDGTADIHNKYLKTHEGKVFPNWAIDDQQWYLVCPAYIEEYQKNALEADISEMTWDHFDVLACASLRECYATDHSKHPGRALSRTEVRECLKKTFLAGHERGMAISSESFNDAYSNQLDFGSVKAWPQYGPWAFWPVPLTMLVYHESMIHSWYELHSYNVPWRARSKWAVHFQYGGGKPRLMAALDALYGCPPDVSPFGAQYGYSGNGTETYLYKYRFEDPQVQVALKEALPVAKLHEKIGKLEMVDFKFLSDDGNVQETTFADGTRIVANFGHDVYGSPGGIDHVVIEGVNGILPESWKVVK